MYPTYVDANKILMSIYKKIELAKTGEERVMLMEEYEVKKCGLNIMLNNKKAMRKLS